MKAEIIAVGTELLLGQVVNTNAAYLSRSLAELGIDVYYQSVVGDNRERLLGAAKESFARSDLVIFTGGLGPTSDDITRETISEFFDLELEIDEDIVPKLKRYFENKHAIMPKTNIRQAMVPRGAVVLDNDCGTAPGLIIEKDGKTAVLLPGPPREMETMYQRKVRPYLEGKSSEQIYSKILKFFGIGESALEVTVADIIENQTDPTVAPYIGDGGVTLRITAKSSTQNAANEKIEPVANEIKARLSRYFYGEDDETLAFAVCRLLRERNMSIATAESCTGGMVGEALTSVSGSSECYGFGVVTYANEAKERLLGVRRDTLEVYGAVSEQTACEMALGALRLSGADIALSVTGIAGPDGGSAEKPVGLVYIGFAAKDGVCTSYKNVFGGDRSMVRSRAVNTALNIARLYLEGSDEIQ